MSQIPSEPPMISVGATPRRIVQISAGVDTGQIAAAWQAGNDVSFTGALQLTRSVPRVFGASIRGLSPSSSIILPPPSGPAFLGSYSGEGSDNGIFSGFTFDCQMNPNAQLYNAGYSEPGLNFRSIRHIEAQASQLRSPGATWSDCDFIRSGLCSSDNGVAVSGCRWDGQPAIGNELVIGGNNVTLSNSRWRGTCRGMVIRWAMDNFNASGLTFSDCNAQDQNANEIILLESSGPLTNSSFNDIQIHNCFGRPVALDGGGASNVNFSGLDIQGGAGFQIGYAADMGGDVSNVNLGEFEMRDVLGISLNLAKGVSISNGCIRRPSGTWMNQRFWQQAWYTPRAAIMGAAAVKAFANVTISELPAGWSATDLRAPSSLPMMAPGVTVL